MKTQDFYHYLLDLLNNPTKFQLNWIRTETLQLNLLDIAVTLIYIEGH